MGSVGRLCPHFVLLPGAGSDGGTSIKVLEGAHHPREVPEPGDVVTGSDPVGSELEQELPGEGKWRSAGGGRGRRIRMRNQEAEKP